MRVRADLVDWTAINSASFGRDPGTIDVDAELAACTAPDRRVHRFLVRDADGRAVAAGAQRLPGPVVRLPLGRRHPARRPRPPAYTALLAVRIAAARALGLRRVGLYARTDTSWPIVARQGFVRAGPMAYWTRGG
ncbi:MAG: hypothetical protein R3F59_14790 [Myxococcota bacterium]